MKQLTDEQIKELWEWCGLVYDKKSEGYTDSNGRYLQFAPKLDLNNLFKYAVPKALDKLETRFDTLTNTVRGLELLFSKWIHNLTKGYSVEDALFRALWQVKEG